MSDPWPQKCFVTSTGTSITRLDKNHIHIDFKNIQSVGLENIIDVELHSINTILNSTSHLIKFRNGGEVAFVYNNKGCLIDLFAKGVDLFLGQNNELIFSIRRSKEPNA